MKQALLFLVVSLVLSLCRAAAVETGTNGIYDTTAPTSSNITGWNEGWGGTEITGWDYVGKVNNGSGVYLGNGWVLTAAHIGEADFILGGTYTAVANSIVTLATTDGTTGTADLMLFRIATNPDLPSLTIATSTRASQVVMLGLGGGRESWGVNTISHAFGLEPIAISNCVSIDFATNDTSTGGTLVDGDSGGGDFTYNTTTGEWELAGINETTGSYSLTSNGPEIPASFMVALSEYASQINAITTTTSVPEPGTWLLVGVGAFLLWARSSRLRGTP